MLKSLFPYLNGEDLNSRPDCSASRWVIDFNQRSLAEARSYKRPMARVEERVKPEREQNRSNQSREAWWRYERSRPEMRKAIAELDEVLVWLCQLEVAPGGRFEVAPCDFKLNSRVGPRLAANGD